jgi:hypothetical protein
MSVGKEEEKQGRKRRGADGERKPSWCEEGSRSKALRSRQKIKKLIKSGLMPYECQLNVRF